MQGYANTDQEMGIILQSVLAKNYPKVRKGLYVFPINWFVQLFWDTLLKPLLSTLQPDIEDKVCLCACVPVGGHPHRQRDSLWIVPASPCGA
jgi:hypothetical protein